MELDELTMVEQVREAIENNEILVYYQPQYNSMTTRMVNAEALVRWKRSDGTMVPPDSYIPLLEKTDAILDLDWYVLHRVCTFLKKRRKKKEYCLEISVNFSRRHIQEPDFHDKLCEIVDDYGLPRHLIQIEITESMMLEDTDEMMAVIWDIRSSGFDVAIDNFGSGLSSLIMVKDSAANILKIDRALLSDNCQTHKERVVLESIFDFANRLKLTTVAEGVETQEQLGFLRTCGCTLVQGFLLSKPLPEEEFAVMCSTPACVEEAADILVVQRASSASRLLLQAVFQRFSMVYVANITRNSFYMMSYHDLIDEACPTAGVFEEVVQSFAAMLHPNDKEGYLDVLSVDSLLRAHEEQRPCEKLTLRYRGPKGVYWLVESCIYFVENDSVDDVLAINFCQLLRNLTDDEIVDFQRAVRKEES